MSGPASLRGGPGFRLIPPDGSRDLRIEDPTNRWIVHLSGRLLLPLAVRLRIPANAVSILGLALGAAGALCFYFWQDMALVVLGLLLCTGWLIADGLDGMIARATGTTSAVGRALDGMCDHGVFILLYLALVSSIGTGGAWLLAAAAGLAHLLQSTLYEAERVRFHRRLAGKAAPERTGNSRNPLVRVYDMLASSLDRWSQPFDRLLEAQDNPRLFGEYYGAHAVPALKPMWILSNNMRVVGIFVACAIGDPRLFWWFELGPLSLVVLIGILWHRRIEARLVTPAASTLNSEKIPSERSTS